MLRRVAKCKVLQTELVRMAWRNINNNNEYLYRIAHQCKSTVIKGVVSKIA